MVALQVRALVKLLADGRRRFRLQIPGFHLASGDLRAIVGKTGAGKTTALDVLALATRPDSAATFQLTDRDGRVWPDLTRLPARSLAQLRARNFGYVLQTNPLFSFLSLYENARLTQRIGGVHDADYLEFLFEALDLHLPRGTRIAEMSMGQRQRLSIVRALAHRPPLVLCDEPTAALDDETASLLMGLLVALARDLDTAVLIVTHDNTLVDRFGFTRHVLAGQTGDEQRGVLLGGGVAA
jgi:putative ABC transport system ATP-binding protein